MKRKVLISLIVMLAIVMLTATVIFAGTYRNVTKDTTCDPIQDICYDNYGVYIQASTDMASGCKPAYIGYIGWDLTGETRTWQSASLKLTHYKTTGGTPPFTLKVYPANNDTWTEDGSNPGYDDTQELATADYNGTDTTLTFASDALGSYFLNKKGGEASIAIVMTDGCGSGSGTVEFEDMEGSGGTAPQSANEADLIFYTGQVVNGTPTAVEMKSFQAENNNPSTPNWPLIAGLFALVAVVVVGVGYSVRRSKQS